MNIVTMGGMLVGLSLLIWKVVLWWPGTKALKKDAVHQVGELLPWAYGFCYGVLGILTVGGIVGAAFDFVVWGTNWMGDAAYVWGVGGAAQSSVTRATIAPLTSGGLAVMWILTVIWLVTMKKKEALRQDLTRGAWSGAMLGLTKGVAGVAVVPLASLVNLAGAWISTEVFV